MMTQHSMSVDEFLDHSSGGGQRGSFLKKWRKLNPPKITVWLHTQAGFSARWSHSFYRLQEREDRDTGEKVIGVYPGQWVCHEREMVLKKQYYFDPNGDREYPPEVCPMCKMIDLVRLAILNGDLSWTDPIFKFEGADHTKTQIITAGGICGAFGKKDMTSGEKAELRRAGIKQTEAFRESGIAKCQYVFIVLDNEDVDNGLQIATEANALGNAMKEEIRRVIVRLGGGEQGRLLGNPLRNPYPFLWEYNDQEHFSKKYRVTALDRMPMSDEVKAHIVDAPVPDVSSYFRPGNVKAIRLDMEAAALIDLPWGDIFDAAEAKEAKEAKESKGESSEQVSAEAIAESPPQKRSIGGTKPVTKKEAPAAVEDTNDFPASYYNAPKAALVAASAPSDELYVCDHCEFDSLTNDMRECPRCHSKFNDAGVIIERPCPGCGLQMPAMGEGGKTICPECALIVDTELWVGVEPPKPSAPVRRTRAQAAAEAAAAPVATPRKSIGGNDGIPWGRK